MLDTTLLRRVSSLPFQKLNDEVLVVDPRTREVHLLNLTATRIWDLLEHPSTPAALLAVLREEFDAPDEALRADIRTLLAELGAKGLVGPEAGTDDHFAEGAEGGAPPKTRRP
ncbi:MAG: HPr-rel-A system PqqD family peptide chaperone [Myxococcales bacterium]